jgi:hypothetical protein
VREYAGARRKYDKSLESMRGIEDAPHVKAPIPPQPLLLWLELKSWNTHQLVAGGLMDQPSYVWDLIQLAGVEYEKELREFAREEEALEATKKVAQGYKLG